MVADKIHSRATGPLKHDTRQPASGRSNNGGLRIGEMESWALWSHGISSFTKESFMERSDKFNVQIDETNGLIQYDNDINNKCNIQLPYAMKLMLQELETMSIAPRLVTETNISNKPVFDYLKKNYSSGKNIDNIYNDNIPEDLYEDN